MKEEYIIISKTAIEKRIEELKEGLMLSAKGTVAQGILLGSIAQLEQILSQSTPLIPENIKPLQELIDEGYDPYDSAHHLQVQRMLKVIQEYVSNLKIDI